MKEIIEEFVCTVTKDNRTITVTYCHPTYSHSGTCIFESHNTMGTSKPIRQKFIIMTSCEMGDVIEYIYQTRGLTSEDFNEVSLLIREHSREQAELVSE